MAFPNYGTPSPTGPNQDKAPGLGQLMQSVLGSQGGNAEAPPPQGPQGPAPMAPPPPMIPGALPMPGPGGPMQGAMMSPEEHQAILEQIKAELMKDIAGQSGQQDRMFAASAGLSRYRPMGNPNFPNIPNAPTPPLSGMPQDAQYPPGMSPGGLDRWRKTGNPNPGMGLPPRPLPPMR